MKYEIRKRSKDGKTWNFYACTDIAENAFEIRAALMFYSDEIYSVFKADKEIKTIQEAMRR